MRVLDSLIEQVHGDTRPDLPGVELVRADVRDAYAVLAAVKGVDSVIHLAAEVGVGQSMYAVERYVSVNEAGTAVLFEALIKHPVRRVVTASSMSIYGEGLYRDAEGALVETADGVGVFDDLLLRAITAAASPHAVRLCWDVDRRRHARRTPRGARSLPSRHSPQARRRVHLRRRSASNRRLRSLRRAGMRAEPQRARSRYPPPGPPPHRVSRRTSTSSPTGFPTARRASKPFSSRPPSACLITDAWEGIELYLTPDKEVLSACDGQDVADHVAALTPTRAHGIGQAAFARVLAEQIYTRRGAKVDRLLRAALAARGERAAA